MRSTILIALNRFLFNQPYILLSATCLFWAGNAIAGRITAGEVSPFVIVFIRWAAVAIILLSIYHSQVFASWSLIKPRLLYLFAMGTTGFCCFNGAFYLAANNTTAINLGILQGSIPVMVLVGMFFIFSSRISLLQIIGTIITIAGVAVVATNGNLDMLLEFRIAYGDGLMILACLLYSTYTIFLRNRPSLSRMVMMTVFAVSACFSSLFFVGFEILTNKAIWPKGEMWYALAYIVLFPSLFAQVFFIRGVELIGPGRAGIFVNLVPIFTSILAVIILDEKFQIYHSVALVLVLGGIFIAERLSLPNQNSN